MECTFEAERSFGPPVSQCRRPFDFTLLFELTFFQLVPSCVFIAGALTRLLTLSCRSGMAAASGILYTLKLVCDDMVPNPGPATRLEEHI